jgi:hypothetical protein
MQIVNVWWRSTTCWARCEAPRRNCRRGCGVVGGIFAGGRLAGASLGMREPHPRPRPWGRCRRGPRARVTADGKGDPGAGLGTR